MCTYIKKSSKKLNELKKLIIKIFRKTKCTYFEKAIQGFKTNK